MASIREEALVRVAPEAAWSVIRDVGALHTRLVPGFVWDTALEPGARIVTFASGRVLRELIVDCDDAARRLVWSARGDWLTHHNAALQVDDAAGGQARIVWIADLLPQDAREAVSGLMDQGMAAMRRTLEAGGSGAAAE